MWVDSLSYLGIRIIASKKFKVDLTVAEDFFAAVNCIYSRCNATDDLVKLLLMEMRCLPILIYASEAVYLDATRRNTTSSWWNSV